MNQGSSTNIAVTRVVETTSITSTAAEAKTSSSSRRSTVSPNPAAGGGRGKGGGGGGGKTEGGEGGVPNQQHNKNRSLSSVGHYNKNNNNKNRTSSTTFIPSSSTADARPPLLDQISLPTSRSNQKGVVAVGGINSTNSNNIRAQDLLLPSSSKICGQSVLNNLLGKKSPPRTRVTNTRSSVVSTSAASLTSSSSSSSTSRALLGSTPYPKKQHYRQKQQQQLQQNQNQKQQQQLLYQKQSGSSTSTRSAGGIGGETAFNEIIGSPKKVFGPRQDTPDEELFARDRFSPTNTEPSSGISSSSSSSIGGFPHISGNPATDDCISSPISTTSSSTTTTTTTRQYPKYILQFNPAAEVLTEEVEVKEPILNKPFQESQQEQRNQEHQVDNKVQLPSKDIMDSSSANRSGNNNTNKPHNNQMWSSTLQPVAEERSFEAEEGTSRASSSREEGGKRIFSDKKSMLIAMRKLVLKQQEALQDLAAENKEYRLELADCHAKLDAARAVQVKQREKMEQLHTDRVSSQEEVRWLREEMKSIRAELMTLKEADQLQKQFFALLNGDKDIADVVGRKEDESELFKFLSIKKSLMNDDAFADILDRAQRDQREQEQRRTREVAEARDDLGGGNNTNSRQSTPTPLSPGGSSSQQRQQDDHSSLGHSSSRGGLESSPTASRTREEVALFKYRLEAIQLKRQQRKVQEGSSGSRSGRVRFT